MCVQPNVTVGNKCQGMCPGECLEVRQGKEVAEETGEQGEAEHPQKHLDSTVPRDCETMCAFVQLVKQLRC